DAADILAEAQRRGGVEVDEHVEAGSEHILRRLEAVADGRKLGGGVARKRRRPVHQASRAIAPGDAQDLVAVAAHGDRVEEPTGAGWEKRRAHQGFPRNHPDFLRRPPLRPPPRKKGERPLPTPPHCPVAAAASAAAMSSSTATPSPSVQSPSWPLPRIRRCCAREVSSRASGNAFSSLPSTSGERMRSATMVLLPVLTMRLLLPRRSRTVGAAV